MTKDREEASNPPATGRFLHAVPKWLLWVAGTFVALLLILFIISFFLDEPLRKKMEGRMNQHLKGYKVRLPKLHFQLVGLSMTLKGLTISQEAHPAQPVAEFGTIEASVNWRGLLAGKLVSEMRVDRPKIHIDLPQLRAEKENKTPVKERGWQQALEDIYPLKINHLVITDGDFVYIDQDPDRPLHLSKIDLQANNIRNVRSADQVYPSSFHLETVIFGSGRGTIDGTANFLAEPFPGIKAQYSLQSMPLSYFKPVASRFNFSLHGGVLDSSGAVEYAPKVKTAHVTELTIKGMTADYVHSTGTSAAEKRRSTKVKKTAGNVSNKPGLLLRLDKLKLTGCTVGMVNKSVTPPYRVFLADTDLTLTNLSNHFEEGPAEAHLKGKFMGSGATTATAHFRPEKQSPDFDLHVRITDTELKAMNDLLRAYGNFDVAAGYFSFFSELRIKNNAVAGYVKPLFRDIQVYDRRKDKEKSVFHKMYELLIGGVAKLLENRPRAEVATKADISGPLQKPETSALQILGQLIKNAFIKAILPGFEREVTRSKK